MDVGWVGWMERGSVALSGAYLVDLKAFAKVADLACQKVALKVERQVVG